MAGSVNSQRLSLTLGQYASSLGHMAYCYAVVAVAAAVTHFCLLTEGWLKLTWAPGSVQRWLTRLKTVTDLGSNRAQHRVTTLDESYALPLRHTGTCCHRDATLACQVVGSSFGHVNVTL